jgi:hypothetical protein
MFFKLLAKVGQLIGVQIQQAFALQGVNGDGCAMGPLRASAVLGCRCASICKPFDSRWAAGSVGTHATHRA